ncbi:MAG: HPr(Ser) kinase/phosphatase [Ignavibacterium album]|uniref:HPr(Ser) kinase/phosphatase n=1 Tax=Ignavibacterium album TaxID=591197 RepID=UPI0026EE6388|nr:HPr(Ser) kinase/phosphatase [Ignavibacterium album]MCX8105349.1 HPr(Ser) kinase/phosphatase [Ignavibacterium album]
MIKIDEKNIVRKEFITVEYLYEHAKKICKLKLVSKEHKLENKIVDQNLHRPGLALAGFVDLFSYTRVQVYGNTELRYLEKLDDEQRRNSLRRVFEFNIPCIVITDGNKPDSIFLEEAAKYGVPIFTTEFSTTKLVYLLSDFLDDQFAPRLTVHGSFVDVYGVGIIFMGKSGIGKSEVTLDLIERGHRLVADDVIILTKKGEGILMGTGTDLGKHFMEIRGLGIIDVERMFGIRAIRYQKRLEIVVELEIWDDNSDYTRTGLDGRTLSIMDVEIPYVKLPILPGKNITVISEVIALNYLLKHYGYDSAHIFQERLAEKLKAKNDSENRGVNYFEHDFE